MATFLLLIAPYIELIKMLGIIIGSVIAVLAFSRKVLYKILDEKFLVINTKVDSLSEQVETNLEEIKSTNVDQMAKINQLLSFQEKVVFTDQHILRALITGKYYDAMRKEFLPLYERECISLLYKDYKMLNGNSFIDGIYEELMTLPYEKL